MWGNFFYIICNSLKVFINKEEIIIDVKLVSKIQILATAINSSLFAKGNFWYKYGHGKTNATYNWR